MDVGLQQSLHNIRGGKSYFLLTKGGHCEFQLLKCQEGSSCDVYNEYNY